MDMDFFQTYLDELQTIAVTLQTLSSIVMLVVTLFAIHWAKRQVEEAKKQSEEAKNSRILNAYLVFESRLTNEDARKDRRHLYENNFDNPSVITSHDKEILERVCSTFDILGVLVKEELMYRPLVFKPFYDVIIKCWKQSYDFIEFQRKPARKAETYMQDFEYLFREAEIYRKVNKFPEVTVHPPHMEVGNNNTLNKKVRK